jgi:IS30 family transposase
MSRSAIGTLVERSSRYPRLIHLPYGHSAEQLRTAMVAALVGLAPRSRLTLTWDQGSEMAQHHLLAEQFREGIFFARPASPWQRGTNENTNGLLRQYFPKGTDLTVHSLAALQAVEDRLNNRPRKILSWRTPAEVMACS